MQFLPTRLVEQYGAVTIFRAAVRSIPRRLARLAGRDLPSPGYVPFDPPDLSNPSDTLVSHGARFSVRPFSTDHGIIAETWTEYITRLGSAGLMSFGDVIDLGAHIGGFSVHLALAATVNGKIIAVEPEPGNFALLKQNIEVNGLESRIEAVNAVARERNGVERLSTSTNTGGHFVPTFRSSGLRVDAIDVGELVDQCRPGLLLKIDIEGSEYVVLRRLRDRLAKIDVIVGELHMSRWGRPWEALKTLRRAGFAVDSYGDPRLPIFLARRTPGD